MQTYLEFFIARLGSLIGWLGSLELVPGVSLLSFFAALFVIGLLVNSFLLRGR